MKRKTVLSGAFCADIVLYSAIMAYAIASQWSSVGKGSVCAACFCVLVVEYLLLQKFGKSEN